LEEDFLNDINLDFEAIALKYGVWFPRVSAVGHFKWPLRFNQRFRVDLIDISLRDRSIRYKFEIWNLDDEKISAECEIVIACVSITQRKSISIPAEIRELFANLR
jgi:acyl-CoA thioesterase FadM